MNSSNQANLFDEAMLTRRAAAGNLEVFHQLTPRYQYTAYGHPYYLLGDTSLAEDTTQESFLKAFQALNTFRSGFFHSWLLKIVPNSAYDIFRLSRRHPRQSLFPEDENVE